jgi:hypothetical protein
MAFDDIKQVRSISFQWKANGILNTISAEYEKTRKGDDAWLRVGLLVSGEPEPVPELLLPRWAQQVRRTLKHPSDRMIYLIPGARQEPGKTWKSPFSTSIEMISVGSDALPDGWNQVTYDFPKPQNSVGLWIMADGDNTGSNFISQLRKLVIE